MITRKPYMIPVVSPGRHDMFNRRNEHHNWGPLSLLLKNVWPFYDNQDIIQIINDSV